MSITDWRAPVLNLYLQQAIDHSTIHSECTDERSNIRPLVSSSTEADHVLLLTITWRGCAVIVSTTGVLSDLPNLSPYPLSSVSLTVHRKRRNHESLPPFSNHLAFRPNHICHEPSTSRVSDSFPCITYLATTPPPVFTIPTRRTPSMPPFVKDASPLIPQSLSSLMPKGVTAQSQPPPRGHPLRHQTPSPRPQPGELFAELFVVLQRSQQSFRHQAGHMEMVVREKYKIWNARITSWYSLCLQLKSLWRGWNSAKAMARDVM